MKVKEIKMERAIKTLASQGFGENEIRAIIGLLSCFPDMLNSGYCLSLTSTQEIKNIEDLEKSDVVIKDRETGERFDLKKVLFAINNFLMSDPELFEVE